MNGGLSERHSLLSDVLQDYHHRFSDAYAAAITYTERMPEQLNNELRNALTHLARAVVAADDVAAKEEIDSAARHIERAIRDCYKIAIIAIKSHIGKCEYVIEQTRGGLTKGIAAKYAEINRERKRIHLLEQKSDAQSEEFQTIGQLYQDLFRVIANLYDEMLEEYDLTDQSVARFPLMLRARQFALWAFSLIIAFALGVLTNHYTDAVVQFWNDKISPYFLAVFNNWSN
jgi:hypothetical protein